MFDRERAQFPETIGRIEDLRQYQTLSLELSLSRKEYDLLLSTFSFVKEKQRQNKIMVQQKRISPKFFPEKSIDALETETNEIKQELIEIHGKVLKTNEKIFNILNWLRMPYEQRQIAIQYHVEGANPNEVLHTLRQINPNLEQRDKRRFVRACPIESCRGFLSTQWKCGICGIHTCSKCHIPKSENEQDHTCNADDIATAELIEKDTRPCPQCGTGIFKIDGCDQMWCIECHCAFSWRTGEIETGRVHNPHFFEYQRRTGTLGRNVMDFPCDALEPNAYHGVIYTLVSRVLNARSGTVRLQKKMEPISREIALNVRTITSSHSNSIEVFVGLMNNYRPDQVQDNMGIRVKYLTEEINEAQFKSYLSRNAKRFNKDREIGQVMQTVVFAMTDILNRLIEYLRENDEPTHDTNLSDPERILEITSETNRLLDYANECFGKICNEYKITRVGLFIRNKKIKLETGLYSVVEMNNADGTTRIEPKGITVEE